MATFVLTCLDHEGSLERRMATRESHLAWLEGRRAMVKLAGPLLSETGEMIGSMFILEAEGIAAVEAFAGEDPYAHAGLFRSTAIHPWRVTIGALP